MNKNMPSIPKYLLHIISERGQVSNLTALADELDLHYSGAHRGIGYLERAGLVVVKRGEGGAPLVITAADTPSREARS
jgi:DNA-binding MarR family transcriptional regulator